MEYFTEGILIGLVIASIPGYWFKKRFQIDGHEIFVKNNLLGKETVIIDGKTVFSKFSFFGARYEFDLDGTSYEVEFSLKYHCLGVGITLRKAGSVVFSDDYTKSNKSAHVPGDQNS